jgi:O-antigen/teichoic acid export membrane protein
MSNETNSTSPIQKFGKDIFKYLPSKAVPALIGLLAIPIITRLFEPQDYGNYILTMTTVGLLSLIPGSLLGTSVVRFFAAYEQRSKLGSFYNTLIKGTIACVGGVAIIFFGILQVVRTAIPLELYHLMSIGVLLFILSSIFGVLLHLLNARQKATAYSGFSIWQAGVGLLFGVTIVLLLKQGVDGLLWGSIGAFVIALPFLFHIAFGRAPREGTFSKSIAIEMTKYGGPLIIVGLAAWILSLSDRYIIGLYRGSYEIGLYSASYAFGEQTIIMLWSLSMLAGYPLIVNSWEKQGKAATEDFVGKLTRYYLLIGFPAALGLSILAKPIIGIFTAPAYHEGYRIVPLVVFGAFLLGLQWWAQVGLALYKKTYIISSVVLGAGILNIGLNLLVVPKYGYMGAAATTFISYAFLLGLMILVSRQFFIWKFPFKSLGKIVCASAFMGIAVHFVGNSLTFSTLINLIVGIGVGSVVYLSALFLFREFKDEEIQMIRSWILCTLPKKGDKT